MTREPILNPVELLHAYIHRGYSHGFIFGTMLPVDVTSFAISFCFITACSEDEGYDSIFADRSALELGGVESSP